MAETAATADTAPRRAPARRSPANGSTRPSRASRARSDDLEAQVTQLQSDLKTITSTLTRMGENKVGEVRSTAKQQAAALKDRGEEMLESAQDEFNAIEKQIKDVIREKPLTAVAGAVALGFILAVITR